MKIKFINKVVGMAALFGAMTGCSLTDVEPADRILDGVDGATAINTAGRVKTAVIGVYEAAQRGYYQGAVDRGYPFGAAATEQGDMRGEDMYNDQAFFEITYTNAWTPTTANNVAMWAGLYRVINRANIVLAAIDNAVATGIITETLGNNYRSEVLFLRALSHHEALIHFSRPFSGAPDSYGVPYRTSPIDGTDDIAGGLEAGRGTVASAYAALLKDLDDAERFAPTTGAASSDPVAFTVTPYFANKNAIIALKTRVKLHMRDWAGVITEYDKIKTAYQLMPTPEGPFVNWTSTEAVFSMQNSAISNPGTNASLANMYGNPDFKARGLVKVSPVIWRSAFWVDGDLRKTTLTTSNANGVFSHKYRRYTINDDATPLIRFAEVILNAAEAYARQGDLTTAVTLVNQVRDRAIPASTPSYTEASLGDQNGVLTAIWNERRIEFLAEGRRWADIHRLAGEGLLTGVPSKAQSRSVTAIAQYSAGGRLVLDHPLLYTNDLFVWPIPLDETLNNPTLAAQQNKGY